MAQPLHQERSDGIVVLRMDRPPANATGIALRRALYLALRSLAGDATLHAIVLTGTGRFFCAGADIGELGTPDNQAAPQLRELVSALEAFPIPLIAAINGYAYGGGLELALGCSHRVAARDARLALPEVKLGLIPGAGGTQRLPRLIGVQAALEMILGGEPVNGAQALALGLVDAILEEPLIASARTWAAQASAVPRERRTRGPVRGGAARLAALRCIDAAARQPFEDGLRLEEELVAALIADEDSQVLRQTFLRQGGKQ